MTSVYDLDELVQLIDRGATGETATMHVLSLKSALRLVVEHWQGDLERQITAVILLEGKPPIILLRCAGS
jgi:hypothetical protein